jgi:hypothetical protein
MKRSKRLVTVLALVAFAAAVVPTFAQARPDAGAREIPYLSHGVGVDDESFGGAAVPNRPTEIPYLSHGVGVDEESLSSSIASERSGVAVDDRALPRSTPQPTPVVLTKDSGTTVDFGNPGLTALALMLGLLAGGTIAAMWSRRSRLTPA